MDAYVDASVRKVAAFASAEGTKRSQRMKAKRISAIALGVTLTVISSCALNLRAADESNTVLATLKKYANTSQLAPALEEIVKLTKGGVAESITLAYIQNSSTAYSLDAQDIVRLRDQGVSAQVMTALMQHGDELRRAAAEASKQTQTTATASVPASPSLAQVATTPAAPAVTYVESSSYPASSVSVTYFGSRSYCDNSGYYGYGYGGAFYPSYYSYVPRYYGYCAPRAGFGIGYGGVYAGYARGYYGGYGRWR